MAGEISKAASKAKSAGSILDAAEEASSILDFFGGPGGPGPGDKDEAETQVAELIRGFIDRYVEVRHRDDAGRELSELVEVSAGLLAPFQK